jgi:hypothetical protein
MTPAPTISAKKKDPPEGGPKMRVNAFGLCIPGGMGRREYTLFHIGLAGHY